MKIPRVALLGLLTLFLGLTSSLSGEPAASADKITPLNVGSKTPDVLLKTPGGKDFSLRKETRGQPAVLIFYRGGWCPFCMKHLEELDRNLAKLAEMGFQILAVSPDSPEVLQRTLKKHPLNYSLLSDADMTASDAFGLPFYLDDATVEKYKGYGIELTARHAGRFWLPVPAVYLLGNEGKVAFAYTNPDYRKRLDMESLLRAAQQASQ